MITAFFSICSCFASQPLIQPDIIKHLITLLLLGLCACSATSLDKTEVRLANLEIGQIQLLNTAVVASLIFENFSEEEITITGSIHDLSVNGKNLGRAKTSESITIPPFGSKQQTVEFNVDNVSIFTNAAGVVDAKAVSYTISSELFSDAFRRPAKVSVQKDYNLSSLTR